MNIWFWGAEEKPNSEYRVSDRAPATTSLWQFRLGLCGHVLRRWWAEEVVRHVVKEGVASRQDKYPLANRPLF